MVSHAAHEVNRIEVGGRLPACSLLCVCHIDLGRLDNLERDRIVGLSDPERPSPRLSRIFHHPTHAQRSIKLLDEEGTLELRGGTQRLAAVAD